MPGDDNLKCFTGKVGGTKIEHLREHLFRKKAYEGGGISPKEMKRRENLKKSKETPKKGNDKSGSVPMFESV